YVRAHRALLPPHAPDMLTARRQVIGGTGTCTPLDSQPCRLLPSRHHRRLASQLWPTAGHAERCQRKTRQTTHLQHVPKSVVITRKRHPFEGRSLAVIHSIRRRGVRLVLVILPNGTRSLVPTAWTDWNPESAELCGSTSNISHNLGSLDDLLRLRVL